MTLRVANLPLSAGAPVVDGADFVYRGDAGFWYAQWMDVARGHWTMFDGSFLGMPSGHFVVKAVRGARNPDGLTLDQYGEQPAGRDLWYWRIDGEVPGRNDEGQPIVVPVTRRVVRVPQRVPATRPTEQAPWVFPGGIRATSARPALPFVGGAIVDEDTGGIGPRL